LFDRKYKGKVFFTLIQSAMGALPKKLVLSGGITEESYKQCPILFGQIAWQLWTDYLASNGVTSIFYYKCDRKIYGFFEL
jgi:hypothetical protein